MIYLKEPNTNRLVKFQNKASIGAGFKDWIEATESEVLSYELEEAKQAKIAQCKNEAENLITTQFSEHKQRNILMSQDSIAISEMNAFILPIRVKSNEIENEIEALTTPEEVEAYNINFE